MQFYFEEYIFIEIKIDHDLIWKDCDNIVKT